VPFEAAPVAPADAPPAQKLQGVFVADCDNLRVVLQRFLDQDEPDRVAAMGEGLWPVWWGGARFDEGKAWMRAALRTPSISPAGRAQALCIEGVLAFGQGDYERGEPALGRPEAVGELRPGFGQFLERLLRIEGEAADDHLLSRDDRGGRAQPHFGLVEHSEN
jgi:hypothetical protein